MLIAYIAGGAIVGGCFNFGFLAHKTSQTHRRVLAEFRSYPPNPETRMQIAKLRGDRHGFLLTFSLLGIIGGAATGLLLYALRSLIA